MEAMAHELDFDVFWAKAAKDPNVNNPMGLFYHIIEERALNPIGTIMNDQAQRQKVAAKEKGEKISGTTKAGWMPLRKISRMTAKSN